MTVPIKIKKILVLLDGSQNSFRALDEAIILARAHNSIITGLNVIEFYTMGFQPFTSLQFILQLRRYWKKESKKFMQQAKLRCTKNGVLFSSRIIHGPEGHTIVSFIQKTKFDLIVIGSRGRGAIREVFLEVYLTMCFTSHRFLS